MNELAYDRTKPATGYIAAAIEPTHRDRLRAATRPAHEAVDARFGGFDLTTRLGYASFLTAHHAVVPAIEAVLSRSGAAALLPDWPSRLRAPALRADLAALGSIPAVAEAHGGVLLSTPAMWGMLYVLEGSRLGGMVLAKRVAKNADPVCRGATQYLRHGAKAGLWASFVTMFDASPQVRDHPGAVIDGALAAFGLFGAGVPPVTRLRIPQ